MALKSKLANSDSVGLQLPSNAGVTENIILQRVERSQLRAHFSFTEKYVQVQSAPL